MQKDDVIYRQAAIDEVDSETVSTNPDHFKLSEKFIKFMNDADIASFGKWQWANGFNTALVATTIQLKKLPSAQQWILCSERMPKYEEKVLVCYCGQVRIGYLTDISKNSMWTLQGGSFPIFPIKHDSEKFVAWMPLPEPPEVEK